MAALVSFLSSSLESFYAQVVSSDHAFLEYGIEKTKDLEKLLNNLAVESYLSLISTAKEDVILGRSLIEVHPFTTLEIIVSREDLLEKIHTIYKMQGIGFEYLKNKFFEGISKSLQERLNRDEILQYIESFSSKVKISPVEVTGYVEEKKWQQLLERVLVLK